jgi:hypothetical protein
VDTLSQAEVRRIKPRLLVIQLTVLFNSNEKDTIYGKPRLSVIEQTVFFDTNYIQNQDYHETSDPQQETDKLYHIKL